MCFCEQDLQIVLKSKIVCDILLYRNGGIVIAKRDILDNLCISEIDFVNTYIAAQKNYPMKNKCRYRWGMLYTIKGTEIYTFSSKTIYAEPDSVLIIPKGEAYTIELNDEESQVITVDFELANEMKVEPFIIRAGNNKSIPKLFKEMAALWQGRTPYQSAELKSFAYKIISQLILSECTYTNSKNYTKISSAVEYMHKHCLEPDFSITKLSEISGISDRYFEQLFFKEYKVSPRRYITMYKIDLAGELLRNEKKSITDVAMSLGYNDIYHFSKIFKKYTGMTPSECKRR